MPRSVLKFAYTTFPWTDPAFPNQTEGHLPLLEIGFEVGGIRFASFSMIDSGAGRILLPMALAVAHGVNLGGSPQTPVVGVAGAGTGLAVDARITVLRMGESWNTRVTFCDGLDAIGMPLLGQYGFFDHCDVDIRLRARQFKISI